MNDSTEGRKIESGEGPHFNLKVVVHQTGLKPDTLRAWERRYGLPSPERSPGGHRLYSWQDIEVIRWLVARQAEGLSIKRAVELWRQIEEEGHDPLAIPVLPSAVIPSLTERQAEGETLAHLRKQWVRACLAYDESHAEQTLNQAFAYYSPEIVALDLLLPAVAEIGEGWYRREVTVQQEHFCTSLAIRRIEAMLLAAPAPMRVGRILAACPPNEEHVFSLLVAALLLRRRGWEVVYLGANVPLAQLASTLEATDPRLVIMSAQRLQTGASLQSVARFLQREKVPLAYGGMIFNRAPELRSRIPGHFLGEQLRDVPLVVESLMTMPRIATAVDAAPEGMSRALEQYRMRLGRIEAQLEEFPGATGLSREQTLLANRELSSNLQAALLLGDASVLGSGIYSARELLGIYDLPPGVLAPYLVVYRQAAVDSLGQQGEPIVSWLDAIAQSMTQVS